MILDELKLGKMSVDKLVQKVRIINVDLNLFQFNIPVNIISREISSRNR